MPVHQFVHDQHLVDQGLTNYWGYNSLAYFAPHNGYASRGSDGQQVQEFRAMVKALHHAGMEVILDVVYNHTAEGSHMGPTLASAASTTPRTTASATTSATTTTPPAPGTRCSCGTRTSCR